MMTPHQVKVSTHTYGERETVTASSMWSRDKAQEHLYNLTWNSKTYEFLLTDLRRVFREKLTFNEIERRADQLGLPFALSNPEQISAFLKVISENLEKAEGIFFDGTKSSIHFESAGIKVKWEFYPTLLSEAESIGILSNMINGLYGAIGNLGSLIRERERVIYEKNLVLDGIDEAMQRRVDYRAPRYLEDAYNDRKLKRTEYRDEVALASLETPRQIDPVVRGLKKKIKDEEELLDSDATQANSMDSDTASTADESFMFND